MYKRTVAAALVFGAAAIAPPAVHAQSNCAPRELITERLQSKFSERLTGGGLQNANQMLEIWTSDRTGSFTVIVSRADGISCIVASGHNWDTIVTAMIPDGTAS
ncbi:MAG: hypothetical protein ABJQ34_06930 [Paracoccaceae bacterium]